MIHEQKEYIFDLLDKIERINSLISIHQSVEESSDLTIEQYRFQKSDLASHLLGVIADLDLKEEIKKIARIVA
jgi:carbon monoxide dehydrogenase subunit G